MCRPHRSRILVLRDIRCRVRPQDLPEVAEVRRKINHEGTGLTDWHILLYDAVPRQYIKVFRGGRDLALSVMQKAQVCRPRLRCHILLGRLALAVKALELELSLGLSFKATSTSRSDSASLSPPAWGPNVTAPPNRSHPLPQNALRNTQFLAVWRIPLGCNRVYNVAVCLFLSLSIVGTLGKRY